MPQGAAFQPRLEAALARRRAGDPAGALRAFEGLLAEAPDDAVVLANLASLNAQAGHNDAALGFYRRALSQPGPQREIWFNYANLLQRLGRPVEEALRRALPLHPAQVNLANLLRDQQRIEDAEQMYRAAMESRPDHALAFANLGTMLVRLDRSADAEPLLRRAVSLDTGRAGWWTALGLALKNLGHAQEAITCWQRAVTLDPGSVDAHNNLGALHRLLRRSDLAIDSLERAHRLAPHDAEVEANLAHALLDAGRVTDAGQHADNVLARDPQRPEAQLMRGFALVLQARVREAFDSFTLAHHRAPELAAPIGNMLFSSLYDDDRDAAALLALHRELAGRIVPSAKPRRSWPRSLAPDRPLRIGYVSPDLRSHPVSFFFEPILTHHDPAQVTAICYSSGAPDELTARLRCRSALWRDTFGKSDAALCAEIEADSIDILVDMSGHTAQNRAAVFRARPAPVQVLYIGYPGTSGLPEIDWIVADAQVCPPGHERFYSERIARVDGSFWCWRPPDGAPQPNVPPCTRMPFITFGSYNHLPKISDTTVRLWAAVLAAVPGSRLLLKALSFVDERVRQATHTRFAAAGLAPERVEPLAPTFDRMSFLGDYRRIDIALDPAPYTGGATTCEALWMGVPVVTLAGEAFCSRMSTSFLHSLGLSDLVARDADDYVRIAAALARDGARLAALRAGLRKTMASSSICDGPRAARALEAAYRTMWRDWLARQRRGEISS